MSRFFYARRNPWLSKNPALSLRLIVGTPANGLALGTGLASIGPRGLRYRIKAFGPAIMEVERLTSEGPVDEGWPGFKLLESVSGVINLDPSNLEGGYRGPFVCSPVGEKVTAIEYSVSATNGLIGIGKTGYEYAVTSSHQFEYRDMDVAGVWTVLPQTVSGHSRDVQGFTFRHELPYPMRPECRIKRMPKIGGANSAEVMDDMMWYGLRGLRQIRPATSTCSLALMPGPVSLISMSTPSSAGSTLKSTRPPAGV